MRELTFENVLREMHGLVGRTVRIGVHVGRPGTLDQLAGFAGRLLGADELPHLLERFDVDPDAVPDTVAFEVVGGTPGRGQSRFYLARSDFRGARWRDSVLIDRELLIEVEGGAFTVAIDPLESEDDPG